MKHDNSVLPDGVIRPNKGNLLVANPDPEPALTAIDLYSGIGGWGLGLKMAGIQVVASYERSSQARETQIKNQGGNVIQCDIRDGSLHIPQLVDCVVGSPPCTEFSFSNKGGNGDIEKGLKDIARFLEIIDQLQPPHWILENVPRVKSILHTHVYSEKGKLKHFRHLFEAEGVHVRLFDMSRFGLPQKRIRCLAGKFPAELVIHTLSNAPPVHFVPFWRH